MDRVRTGEVLSLVCLGGLSWRCWRLSLLLSYWLVPPSQFQDPDFGGLSGGRVVRIAVHPDYQGVTCPRAFKPGAIISCRRVAGRSMGQVYLVV